LGRFATWLLTLSSRIETVYTFPLRKISHSQILWNIPTMLYITIEYRHYQRPPSFVPWRLSWKLAFRVPLHRYVGFGRWIVTLVQHSFRFLFMVCERILLSMFPYCSTSLLLLFSVFLFSLHKVGPKIIMGCAPHHQFTILNPSQPEPERKSSLIPTTGLFFFTH